MEKIARKGVLGLVLAVYFVSANGVALESVSQLYSTGGQVAIALHSGPAKDFPVPSLTERSYVPQTSPVVILSIALLAHPVIYPVEHRVTYVWVDDTLPFFTAVLSSSRANRAPPVA